MGGAIGNQSSRLIAAGGMPDHVHLLVSMPRTLTVADLVRAIKSNSSGWIHKELPNLKKFRWQDGYGAFAVSYSGIDAVKNYLANQVCRPVGTRCFVGTIYRGLTHPGY